MHIKKNKKNSKKKFNRGRDPIHFFGLGISGGGVGGNSPPPCPDTIGAAGENFDHFKGNPPPFLQNFPKKK